MHQARRPPLIAAPARCLTPSRARHLLASLLAAALVLAVTVPGATAVPPDPSTVEPRVAPLDSLTGFNPSGRDTEAGLGFLQQILDESAEQDRFLPVDDAFRLAVTAYDPERLLASWRIEPGHYLYRERIQVELADGSAPGTSLASVELPQGDVQDDPYFGPVEIYRNEVSVAIALVHAGAAPRDLDLAVTYQGCADAGLCYPPERKGVSLSFESSGSAGAGSVPVASYRPSLSGAPNRGLELSDADLIARTLSSERLFIALAAFFGFGLVLSLTPCVLPMIPVLSSVLAALGGTTSTVRGFALSLAYVTASAVAYAIIGWVAGLLGANLQIVLQSPAALAATSALFVALSLAMFGVYELRVPAGWQTRVDGWARRTSRAGGYAGAAAMGVFSALVVGPCVAAPLAGAVIYIGQAGDPVRGGLALFALGLGMGAPLLALGASAGRLLPRAGRWMRAVEPAIGVVMLGIAVYLLERILPPSLALGAWAAVALTAAVLLARTTRREAAPRVRYASGAGATAAAVYAVVLVAGAATGADSPLRPFGGLRSAPGPGIEFIAIKGLSGPAGLETALGQVQATGRFAMLDFYADWCVSCKEFEDTTLRDRRVRAALANVMALRADVTANDEADRELMRRLGILGPPAILFFAPDRSERRRYRLFGFEDADDFSSRVEGATDAA